MFYMINTFLGKCFSTHILHEERRMRCKFPFTYENMTFNKCIKHNVRGHGNIAICPKKNSGNNWYGNMEYGGCDFESCEGI